MQYEVRAMSLGEIIDTSFRILRNHFVPLVGMSAVVYLPFSLAMAAWQIRLQTQVAAGGELAIGSIFGQLGVLMLTIAVVMPIVSAAVSHAVGEAYLGREVNIAGSLRAAVGILLPTRSTCSSAHSG